MIKISNKTLPIRVFRGDTFDIAFIIDLSHNPIQPTHYELGTNDKLYIGITEGNKLFEDAILKKIATKDNSKTTDGDPIVRFESMDTEFLCPGTYYIQAKLLQSYVNNGVITEDITTVIPPVVFNII